MALSLSGGLLLTDAHPVRAHGTGPHGGQIGHAEDFNVEVVVTASGLEIYLIDKDMKSVSIGPFEASAVVQSGNQREMLTLVSFGENQMKSDSTLASRPDAKTIVILKPKGKPPIQVSFGH
ncbi:MAG: hypothetical protein EBY21_00625 [Alphaproteobacteria bacterium]|nr:hypothetical protein [Alphaproteobacteria bacterium]